jgi:hypothetical protein
MTVGSPSLRCLCLAAAAAWLLFAAVFLTVGSSATPATASRQADGRAVPASAVTTSDAPTNHGLSILGGTVGQATKVWSLSGFVNDLRKPRPPRHRSERPTTGADGIDAMMTSSILRLMLRVNQHRPLLFEAAADSPLAGHYRSLLRPPSVLS